MRIIFMGTVWYSFEMLKHLLTLNAQIVGVVTKTKSSFNSDFQSLLPLAEKHRIPSFIVQKTTESDMVHWIRSKKPDLICCFGWSHLLSSEILKIPSLGVVGHHPSPLPRGRGRHPTIWALALGLKETASTFLFLDDGIDSGDLINQVIIPITDQDDAASLYRRQIDVSRKQLTKIYHDFLRGDLVRFPQDVSQATYWRKRVPQDGKIDWRMSSFSIDRLVRALTRPYPGAYMCYQGKEIKIWKTEISSIQDDYAEPGKILKSDECDRVIIACGEGAVLLKEHEFTSLPKMGEYLSF